MSTKPSSSTTTFAATRKERAVKCFQFIVHAILEILSIIQGKFNSLIPIVKEGELHWAKSAIRVLRSSINMATELGFSIVIEGTVYTIKKKDAVQGAVLVRQNQFERKTSDLETIPEENVLEKRTERRSSRKAPELSRQNQIVKIPDLETTSEEDVSEKKTEHTFRKNRFMKKDPHVHNLPLEKVSEKDAEQDREISSWGNDIMRQELGKEFNIKQLVRSQRLAQRELIAEQEASRQLVSHTSRLETKIRNIEAALKVEKENHRRQYAERERLQEEVPKLKERLAAEEESRKHLLEEKSKLEMKNQDLEKNCKQLTQNYTQLTQANAELEIKVQNLDQNSKTSVRERDLEQKSLELEKELANLKEAVQDILETEVENRAHSNNEKKELELKVQEMESALGTAQASLEEEAERFVCKICFDRPRNALCMPCRHFVCCQPCLKQHMKTKTECPVCRKCIKEVVECYT